MKLTIPHSLFLLTILVSANAQFNNYFQQLGRYFGYGKTSDLEVKDIYAKRIPYEVSTADERFIAEAAKLTGVALTELDSCQHRVSVVSAKTDCFEGYFVGNRWF